MRVQLHQYDEPSKIKYEVELVWKSGENDGITR